MLTQSNPGAVGFSSQQAAARMHYLATENSIFEFCFVIRSILDYLKVLDSTLMFLGIDHLIPFEDSIKSKS